MTVSRTLWTLALASLALWAAWAMIIWRVNPFEVGWFGHLLFYIVLFFALAGTLVTALLWHRLLRQKRQVIVREIRLAIRHSLLLAGLAVLSLFFVSINLFSFFMAIGLIAAVAGIEYLFLQLESSRRG